MSRYARPLPEPIPKCAICGIRRGNRLFPVHDVDGTLLCDKCIVEAQRGARMDEDFDEDRLPTLKAARP